MCFFLKSTKCQPRRKCLISNSIHWCLDYIDSDYPVNKHILQNYKSNIDLIFKKLLFRVQVILRTAFASKREFYILHINCSTAEDEERIRRKESASMGLFFISLR